MSDPQSDYLCIPPAYGQALGDLRWAANGEAVDYPDGATFAFAPQVAQFLEGFASGRGAIHFAHVFHLLWMLGLGKRPTLWDGEELRLAFEEAGRPLRNAGALCALLCRYVPGTATPVDLRQVCRRLASPALMAELCIRWAVGQKPAALEAPPLTPGEFVGAVLQAARCFTPEELRHWFRHGHIPLVEAADDIAEALDVARPRTLGGVLADLAQRPRFAGAIPLVGQMVSALTLPPRRLSERHLPVGGYSDVATHGHPEQILPSQFALDVVEFLRRFAEKELLYFRREDPHVQVREELVVVLDQGVRTWGEGRLLLAAALLAFGKMAERRRVSFLVAGTSNEGKLLAPLTATDQEVQALLEASDLSANPGLALERVLEDQADGARDVVLLTHPRNLAERDVRSAALRAGSPSDERATRLFTLAADAHGNVELAAMKHGVPINLSRFRVDMNPQPAKAPLTPPPISDDRGYPPWTGDVEPFPFPFRFRPQLNLDRWPFDFDHSGQWLLESQQNGLLHLWRTDGSSAKLLPRPMIDGQLLRKVVEVLGVRGGFVALGDDSSGLVAAVHYDLAARQAHWYRFAAATNAGYFRWYYYPDLHYLVGRSDHAAFGLDLSRRTTVQYYSRGEALPADRGAAQALARAFASGTPPPQLLISSASFPVPATQPHVEHDDFLGTAEVRGVDPPWPKFTPLSDGKPVLRDCTLMQAILCNDVLALSVQHPRPAHRKLRLFRGPPGYAIAEFEQPEDCTDHALSPDGRFLARFTRRGRLQVQDLATGRIACSGGTGGNCHQGVVVALGDRWLTVEIGKYTHLIRWDGESLRLTCAQDGSKGAFLNAQLADTAEGTRAIVATTTSVPAFLGYDRKRWVWGAKHVLQLAVDIYGQIALFDPWNRLVCMFFVFRGQAAAWLPDGTCHGPESLVHGPSSPAGLRRIGAALRKAWHQARGLVGVPPSGGAGTPPQGGTPTQAGSPGFVGVPPSGGLPPPGPPEGGAPTAEGRP